MKGRILVILGHPRKDSFCGALAESYLMGAKETEKEIRLIRLGEIAFDPILRDGMGTQPPEERDLVEAQDSIRWCEHLVFVYPTWWGSSPALLKGFIDRVFLPGFAFKYRDKSAMWDKLLTGRSGRLLVTMDAPPLYDRIVYKGSSQRAIAKAVLGFSGIQPVKVVVFGSVKGSDTAKREHWLTRAKRMGRLD